MGFVKVDMLHRYEGLTSVFNLSLAVVEVYR